MQFCTILFLAASAAGTIAATEKTNLAAPPVTKLAEGEPEAEVEALSRAVFIQKMDEEFARLDADGNGTITDEEIAASQRRAAQAEALRQNQIVFSRLDKDANGSISPQEFAALADPGSIPINTDKLIMQFDTDRDGVITLVEYRIATQTNFDRIDSDRDGVVTKIEMRAAGIAP